MLVLFLSLSPRVEFGSTAGATQVAASLGKKERAPLWQTRSWDEDESADREVRIAQRGGREYISECILLQMAGSPENEKDVAAKRIPCGPRMAAD